MSKKKEKSNYLLERVIKVVGENKKGKVLDLGCGNGDYSKRLKNLGFQVLAADLDEKRFRYSGDISFKKCDITRELPFEDNSFDFCLLLEVIEHLRNPYLVMSELGRILKPKGELILSTPNILNLKSRFRFFFEGAYDFFREPPLDQVTNPKETGFNLHIVPYRFHELEYLLKVNGFDIKTITASVCENKGLFFLKPLIVLQSLLKERRSERTGGIDHSRINKILLSKELLYGRHLVIVLENNS